MKSRINLILSSYLYFSWTLFSQARFTLHYSLGTYHLVCSIAIATIAVNGHEVPLVLPIDDGGFVKVPADLLYISFGLGESSMMVEEEILANYGVIKEGILKARCENDEGFY